jgi:uncharacterized protein with HEPN domain
MSRDDAYLLDILDAARLALQYVRGKTRDQFLEDVQLQDAVIRRLAIIGEAARRVSEPTRLAHPTLPWHDMVGMRNIVIHEYDDVDLDVVWDAVARDLEPLIAALQAAIPPPLP